MRGYRIVVAAGLALLASSCGKKDVPDVARFCSVAVGYANTSGRAVHITGLKGPTELKSGYQVELSYSLAGAKDTITSTCLVGVQPDHKTMVLIEYHPNAGGAAMTGDKEPGEPLYDLRHKLADSRQDVMNVFWDTKDYHPLSPSDKNLYGKATEPAKSE
jgi:hypothetical protein